MKSLILTATALGVAIAGLVLYAQRKNKGENRVIDAAKNAYQIMNDGIGKLERPAHHTMG